MTTVIGTPMVNLGSLYLNGLQLNWFSTTEILVAPGAARDSTNVNDIVVTNANGLTCLTTTQGVGGLDIGTIAANTFYAVYVIGSSLSADPDVQMGMQRQGTVVVANPEPNTGNNPPPAIVISLSFVQPQLPEGYDMFRRVGIVKTDGASHFIPFWQSGINAARTMWYDTAINVLTAGASAAYVTESLAAAIPDAVGQCDVIFDVLLTPTAAGNTVNLRPTGSTSTNGVSIMSGDVAAVVHEDSLRTVAAINGATGHVSVDYKVTGAVTLNVSGYIDNL
jgi:hypothetical protein